MTRARSKPFGAASVVTTLRAPSKQQFAPLQLSRNPDVEARSVSRRVEKEKGLHEFRSRA